MFGAVSGFAAGTTGSKAQPACLSIPFRWLSRPGRSWHHRGPAEGKKSFPASPANVGAWAARRGWHPADSMRDDGEGREEASGETDRMSAARRQTLAPPSNRPSAGSRRPTTSTSTASSATPNGPTATDSPTASSRISLSISHRSRSTAPPSPPTSSAMRMKCS
jgi:hypothetical protein